MTPVAAEPLLGYHPFAVPGLGTSREPAVGQMPDGEFDWGGRPERVSEAPKGSQNGRKPFEECKGRRGA